MLCDQLDGNSLHSLSFVPVALGGFGAPHGQGGNTCAAKEEHGVVPGVSFWHLCRLPDFGGVRSSTVEI